MAMFNCVCVYAGLCLIIVGLIIVGFTSGRV